MPSFTLLLRLVPNTPNQGRATRCGRGCNCHSKKGVPMQGPITIRKKWAPARGPTKKLENYYWAPDTGHIYK